MSEPAGLPAALAPIAEVLALADSFALCVVTGPRDHRDSVYLRLTSSLADDFELVRHRLDRDGLDFFDVLTGGDGVRPRVVFMSGLERMSDATRRDVTVRLNLLRDSWAPHPARVILWLPAWGLGEFRKLAPDLFHWRSCLVALHDADLPIRSEIEYLVWACERYGGTREAVHVSSVDVVLIRLLAGRRSAHIGYSGAARSQLLRGATRHLAMARLAALTTYATDLDVGAYEGSAQRPTLLPLLLSAADMAGRLPAEPGWMSVCRAAGVPLSDIDFLSQLGERGELAVFLDAIDRLDLSPGSPAQRLVAWLDAGHPTIRIVVITADHRPALFDAWPSDPLIEHAYTLEASEPPRGPERYAAVATLIGELFATSRDLNLLADYLLGPELTQEMPSGAPLAETAEAFAKLLERHGLLDRSFFDQLVALRPVSALAIEAVAHAYFGPSDP